MDPYDPKTPVAIAIALLEGRGHRFHVTFELPATRQFAMYGRSELDDRRFETRVEVDIDGRVDRVTDERARYELSRAAASFVHEDKHQDENVLKCLATIISSGYKKNFAENLERLGLKLVELAGEELKRGKK